MLPPDTTVDFDVTVEDALALHSFIRDFSATIKKMKWKGVFSLYVLVGACAFYLFMKRDSMTALIFGIIGIVAVSLIYPKWFNAVTKRSTRRMLEEPMFKKGAGHYRLRFSEDGLYSEGPLGKSHIYWVALSRVAMTDEYLMIVLGGSGFPLPKKQIPEETLLEIKAYLEDKMASVAQK